MKKLILAAILMAAMSAQADFKPSFTLSKEAGWVIDNAGVATTPALSQGMIKRFYAMTNGTHIAIIKELDKCEASRSLKVPINGTMVKFQRTAVEWNCWYIPMTPAGTKFLFEEFKTKDAVKVGAWSYSATGFNELIERMNGDAL